MCIQIRISAHVTTPWNPRTRTIIIPAGLSSVRQEAAIRFVLRKLGVPQPLSGAVCWCGAPIRDPAPLIPTQRHSSEVMARGAQSHQ